MEKMYVDRINGRWECWLYRDGRRIRIGHFYDDELVNYYAQTHNYQIVWVLPNP